MIDEHPLLLILADTGVMLLTMAVWYLAYLIGG